MMTNGKITVAAALNDAVATLSLNKTIETPRLDAEVLLCSALSCERIFLLLNRDMILEQKCLSVFNSYISRRAKNEPVSYIINSKEFMSLEFEVKEGVLIPRPDTEILVEEIIKIYKNKNAKILDLCTGSGAIAISLAYYLDKSLLTAVDKYEICLKTAERNAVMNNVNDRIEFISADVLEPFDIYGDFDCIVSNPPYIKEDVLSTLPVDVKEYEPLYALDGGSDGLIFYRKIVDYAKKKLKSCGILAFEIGFDQGKSVKKIIEDSHEFKELRISNDLAGLNRVVIAEKI